MHQAQKGHVLSILNVRHETVYRYRRDVILGAHRLMLRPRASHDLRLIATELSFSPPASVSWAYDVFGNSVAMASFSGPASVLTIESVIKLELFANAWPIFEIAPAACTYPFDYSEEDRTDLGAMRIPQYSDPEGRLRTWSLAFIRGAATDTLSLLKDLNIGIASRISYELRDGEGTQSPLETLSRGHGSCRDLAVLMIEAARHLGLGARVVSGYLYNPTLEPINNVTQGATHAWVEIFLPGAGWIAFDPTNQKVGGFNLIPVAVARNISQAVPISGSFAGNSNDFLGMSVAVTVSNLAE